MGAGLFWGIIFILVGIGIILKVIFHLNIPVFKLIISFLFIYIGLRILFGDCLSMKGCKNTEGNVIFSEMTIDNPNHENGEYNVVFGSAVIDLRDIELKPRGNNLKVNTVFGHSKVLLNKDMPIKIKANSAFGGAKLPNDNMIAFGTSHFKSDTLKEEDLYLNLELNVVFGSIEIKME